MVHTEGPEEAPRCPKCASTHVDLVEEHILICLDCGESVDQKHHHAKAETF